MPLPRWLCTVVTVTVSVTLWLLAVRSCGALMAATWWPP